MRRSFASSIDRIKARALGLSVASINATLAIAFGSAYANDFSRQGRILRVLIAADAPFRMTPQDVLDLKVRNAKGEMVPFGAFTTVTWTAGPPQIQRYNGYPSMNISGNRRARPLHRRGDGRDGAASRISPPASASTGPASPTRRTRRPGRASR